MLPTPVISKHQKPPSKLQSSSILAPPSLVAAGAAVGGLLATPQFPPAPQVGNSGNKTVIYEKYWDHDKIQAGIRDGLIITGALRVHKLDGYVPDPNRKQTGAKDILIPGKINRNRAFNGDVVAVLFDSETNTAKRRPLKQDSTSDDFLTFSDNSDDEALEDEEEAIFNSLLSSDEKRDRNQRTGKIIGIIDPKGQRRNFVCVLRPNLGAAKRKDDNDDEDYDLRADMGVNRDVDNDAIELLSDGRQAGYWKKSDAMVRAEPIDKRCNWFLIPTKMLERDIGQDANSILDHRVLYEVKLQRWGEDSTLPLGRVVKSIGKAGAMDVEARVCLIEHQLDEHEDPFSEVILSEARAMLEEDINQERGCRVDYSRDANIRIITIDPATARDLDDAIHIRNVPNSNRVEIGVHIADVSHYVQEGSQIDDKAKERCTTVYLSHKALPMLPVDISNGLCSLNPNEEKLAFSCVFQIDKSSGLLIRDPPPKFHKSIIKTCVRFNYDEVQAILDKQEDVYWTEEVAFPNSGASSNAQDVSQFSGTRPRPILFDPVNSFQPLVFDKSNAGWKTVIKDVFSFYQVCKKIREARFSHGSFQITKQKMFFRFNEANIPMQYEIEGTHTASHWLVEELMLLANKCVAEKLQEVSDQDKDGKRFVTLRRHEKPDDKQSVEFIKALNRVGIQFDSSSSSRIQESLDRISNKFGYDVARGVEAMLMKPMKQAEYFAYSRADELNDNPYHFALAFATYTHFTSPIRRYADVLVHRELLRIISNQEGLSQRSLMSLPNRVDGASTDSTGLVNPLGYQCEMCNDKKEKSRKAQEKCDVSFFCIYLRELGCWHYTYGTVTKIDDRSIIVFVPLLGSDSRIHYDTASKPSNERLHHQKDGDGNFERIRFPVNWEQKNGRTLTVTWTDYNPADGPFARQEELGIIDGVEKAEESGNFDPIRANSSAMSKVKTQQIRPFSNIPVVICPLDEVPISYKMFILSPYNARFDDLYQQAGGKQGASGLKVVISEEEEEEQNSKSRKKKDERVTKMDKNATTRIVQHYTNKPV